MANKELFNKLRKMPVRKRIEVASTPEGKSLLQALTPTEFAELFPRYYLRGLPDVSGFNLATTRASQQRQKEAGQSILDKITGLETSVAAAGNAAYEKIKRKLGLGQNPLPSLTKEQADAFEKIKSGGVSLDSPEAKMFSGLSDSQLSSIGISKGKDNTGHDVFNYSQPEVSRAEAESRMSQKTGGSLKEMIDKAAAREGIDPRMMYGIVNGESLHTDHYDKNENLNTQDFSYGPFQMNILKAGMEGDKFQKATGLSVKDPNTLQEQAYWVARKIKQLGSDPDKVHAIWHGYKGNVNWNPEWRSMGAGTGGEGPLVKPEGPNGTYTDQQISKMMDDLRNEKNDARKQQLANLLQGAVSDTATATVKGTSTSKWNDITPLHASSQSMCGRGVLHLAKQLFPDNKTLQTDRLGSNADGVANGSNPIFSNSGMWKAARPIGEDKLTPDYLKSLPDGTIIAAGGGRADGAGHIQMKVNGRWISDFAQNSFIADHPGRDYRGYSILEVSDQGHAELARRGFYEPTKEDVAKVVATPTAPPPPAPVPASTLKEETPVNPNPNPQQIKQEQTASVNGPAAPAAPVTPQQTAEVKPQAARYRFDEAAFEGAVRNKYGILASGYDRAGLVSEFRGKLPEGVTYEKGILTIKDPNSPHIQSIRQDMEKEFGKDAINSMITQIKEEKKAPPKEQPKPETATKHETPPPAPAPKADQPKVEAAPAAPTAKVPGASTGGSFDVGNRNIGFYPMDKRDNMAAVDIKTQQPLFTAMTGESVSVGKGKVDVMPSQKAAAVPPVHDNVRNEINTLRQEISSSFAEAGSRAQPAQVRPIETPRSDNPNFVDSLTKQNAELWNNPVMERAMNRTRMTETGDSLNNHFSYGNTNG